MPPWHADPKYGHFSNDPSLSDAERRLIDEWAADGAALGTPTGEVPLPAAGWSMHTPDVVVAMPTPFAVPAAGDIPYQVFEVDPGFREDVWVAKRRSCRGIAPSFTTPRSSSDRPAWMARAQGELQSFCLCAYALGTPPLLLPDGLAKKLPAGWRRCLCCITSPPEQHKAIRRKSGSN